MKNEAITVMDGISNFCFMKCLTSNLLSWWSWFLNPQFKISDLFIESIEMWLEPLIQFHGGNQMSPKCVFSFQLFSMCLCTSIKISTLFFFGLFSDTKWVISFLKKKNRISTLIFVWACLTGPILLFMLLFCLKISSAFLVTSPNFTHQSC
jgi:hypothetical protein